MVFRNHILAVCIISVSILSGCAGKKALPPTAAVAEPSGERNAPDAPREAATTLARGNGQTTAPSPSSPPAPLQEEDVRPLGEKVAMLELEPPPATVHFDFDSHLLTGEARKILSRHASLLRNERTGAVLIEGHCDERGGDAYNLALGERRAASVAGYLKGLGVPSDRIRIISYGEEKPAVQGKDEEAYRLNRRGELVRE